MADAKNIPLKKSTPAPMITIEADTKKIPVRLIGVSYEAKQPKAVIAMRLGEQINESGNDVKKMIKNLTSLVALIFGSEVAVSIMDRLEDPADDLDLSHIIQLVNKFTELTTTNPNT